MRLHTHRDTRLEKRKHLAVTPIYITQKSCKRTVTPDMLSEAFFGQSVLLRI